MTKKGKKYFWKGIFMIVLFVIWSVMIQTVDVRTAGETGADIGFSHLNSWFHQLTGVHMGIYTLTDWLGLIPVFVCLAFGVMGLWQMIKRKSLLKVDLDILFLGIYYVLVIFFYLYFEMYPVNYRPIFIDGRMEASYPSSTTLLVLSVMPTLVFQIKRRWKQENLKKGIIWLTMIFSLSMVLGRLICGVHWFTDIVGAMLLSGGLFDIYRGTVVLYCKKDH